MNLQIQLKKRQQQASLFRHKKLAEHTRKAKRGDRVESRRRGFTLIEILVVIGIIAVLAAVVLVAINPSRQFKLARDSQRVSNVESILNTVGQNIAEHRGLFTCGSTTTALPSEDTDIKSASNISAGSPGFDLAVCVVPAYISALPFDPASSTAYYAATSSYDTDYFISEDDDGRIKVSSFGEVTPDIDVTR